MVAETESTAEGLPKQEEAPVTAVETAAEAKAEKPARKTAAKARRKARPTAKKPQVRAKERNDEMKNDNIFAAFNSFPGAVAFEKLFTEASQRGEEAVKRSRKAAEELAELYRGNLDAFVEAGRIATSGAQSIGQEFVAKGRDNLEQTANTVRSFAEAKSPTELLQLQSDFARTAFDRFVEESSSLTESVVKLAGEAFQPLSNRASATVERFNQIAA
jgi:phasin family protein